MWVLVIQGCDDDYAASVFDNSKWTVEQGLQDPDGLQEFLVGEGCSDVVVSAYEFKNVDPKFVELVEEFMDYDQIKQSNFYCSWDE